MLSWEKLQREPATRWFDWFFAPILKFDERFARQYRFEPPPEFPLASPYSSIVHHLSGPNKYALAHTPHRRSGTADAAGFPWHLILSFNSLMSFCTRKLAYVLDSLVRVSRRVGKSRFDKINYFPQALVALPNDQHLILSFRSHAQSPEIAGLWSAVDPFRLSLAANWPASNASFSTVSNLLTLFSKFFSSFLHSTCLLSVSHPYLALGEVYLPLWASVPRSSTLWKL